jgi:hypothetical protein
MPVKITIDEVRDRLIATARAGTVITYTDLYGDRYQAHARSGRELGWISMEEHKVGRPLLSVVAVAKETSRPKEGLWLLAVQHDAGQSDCRCGVALILPGEREHDFVARQATLVYRTWALPDPLGEPYKAGVGRTRRGHADGLIVNLDALDKATERHEATVAKLAAFLGENGISVRIARNPNAAFDLGWRIDDFLWIAEVKSLPAGSESQQLRLGLGQVLDYRHALRGPDRAVRAAVVVERRPQDIRWIEVCAAVDVLLVWPDRFSVLL